MSGCRRVDDTWVTLDYGIVKEKYLRIRCSDLYTIYMRWRKGYGWSMLIGEGDLLKQPKDKWHLITDDIFKNANIILMNKTDEKKAEETALKFIRLAKQ